VDAAAALADLIEISSQIESAVLFDSNGSVAASTVDEERARRLVESTQALVEDAEQLRAAGTTLTQIELATQEGSVFLVRSGDQLVVATTRPEPTVGLVFYDLKTCLRNAHAGSANTAPTRVTTTAEESGASGDAAA
jgi:predicted regulator of Ras-like GTPase activity (Roadblock/LC7/MglB family)